MPQLDIDQDTPDAVSVDPSQTSDGYSPLNGSVDLNRLGSAPAGGFMGPTPGPLWPGVWDTPTGNSGTSWDVASSGAGAPAGQPWGGANLYGGSLYNAADIEAFHPSPRVTQSGSWSDPYFPADEGQYGNAIDGAKAIRDYWSSGKGGVYNVDPKTMGMEGGIDIGQQIQDSIDRGGFMRSILDQAVQSGKPTSFDTSNWGLKRFKDPTYTWDGGTVGRWGGIVQGTLTATPDGTWSVNAGLWPQKSGQYDLNAQDGDNWFDNAAIAIDRQVSGDRQPF